MYITLTRPIAFIDIESTGADRDKDRIVELSICKLFPDYSRSVDTFRFNPQMPISASAVAIHGITDEDVKDEPTFQQRSHQVFSAVAGCDIAGFNSNVFDVPLLFNEFQRAGIYWDYTHFKMIDVGNIFKIQEPRTLSAAVKFYCNKEHEGAHSAEADINATVDVFLAQMQKYDTLPETVGELSLFSNYGKPMLDLSGKFSYNDKGQIILNFKHPGEPAANHIGLIQWMLTKDFSADTKVVCKRIIDEYNYKPQEAPADGLPF